jgi:hypothetical protein
MYSYNLEKGITVNIIISILELMVVLILIVILMIIFLGHGIVAGTHCRGFWACGSSIS